MVSLSLHYTLLVGLDGLGSRIRPVPSKAEDGRPTDIVYGAVSILPFYLLTRRLRRPTGWTSSVSWRSIACSAYCVIATSVHCVSRERRRTRHANDALR